MNGNTANIVKILAQAGLTGVTLATLWILWNVTTQHLNRNTEVLIEVREASQAQTAVMGELTDVVKELKFYVNKDLTIRNEIK